MKKNQTQISTFSKSEKMIDGLFSFWEKKAMATTSLQTNLIIRLKEADFQALEGIAEHIHIPVKDLVHGIISYALDQYSKSKTTTLNRPAAWHHE